MAPSDGLNLKPGLDKSFLACFGLPFPVSREPTKAATSLAELATTQGSSRLGGFLPPRDVTEDGDGASSFPAGQPVPTELGILDDVLYDNAAEERDVDMEGSVGGGTIILAEDEVNGLDRRGLAAGSQAHHRQLDMSPARPVLTSSGAQFDLTLNRWISTTAESIDDGLGLATFEKDFGKPINEKTVADAMKFMVQIAAEHKKVGHLMDEATLSPVERKEYARLKTAAEAGSFKTKSYLGNQFRAFLKSHPEKQEMYQCQKRSAAAEFRASWVADNLEQWTEQRREVASWCRVDHTLGKYMNFARIVKLWGGWKSDEAVKGAVTAAQKCLCMGPPWLHVHPQAGFVEFLILDFGFDEKFSQAWEHFRTDYSTGDNAEPPPAIVAPPVPNETKDATKKKGGGAAGAEEKTLKKARTGGETKAEKAPPKDKTPKSTIVISKLDNARLWREANKLKTKLQQASSAWMEVADKIANDPDWAEFQGKSYERLKASHTAVKNTLTDFHKAFMMCADVALMKKNYSTATCEIELASFLKTADLVDVLADSAARICKAERDLFH